MNKNNGNQANIFKALSDNNRLKILFYIHKQECRCKENKFFGRSETCIKDLSKHLDITVPTISHHIKELVNAGLVITKKEGKWVYCKICKEKIKKAGYFLNLFITG